MSACGSGGGSPLADAAAPDAFRVDAGSLDAGPIDAGTPPPMVPPNGWTNAIATSDIAAAITHMGETYTNVASDPNLAVGAPDGLMGAVALGDTGHSFVADLGVGEEAFDGPGVDLDVREIGLPSGIPEIYAVSVSDDPAGPFVMLGTRTGPSRIELAGSGVASARYVRIESVETAMQILDNPGSPTYPSAEIDAVGAFHPGSAL